MLTLFSWLAATTTPLPGSSKFSQRSPLHGLDAVWYSGDELKRYHLAMGHPSIVALIRFLRLAQPNVPVTDADVERLKPVIAACLVCENGHQPRRI